MSFLAALAGIAAIAWLILSICIPFMIHAILGHVKAVSADTKAMRRSINNIETNIYNKITEKQ